MARENAVRLMNQLLELMLKKDASDLFISVGFPPAMKIHGKMTPVSNTVMTGEHTQGLARALMNDRQTAEFERKKDCNFAISPAHIGRFRVNVFLQQNHTAMVIRTITSEVPSADKMNLPPILKELVLEKRGLLVFVGGTGTGKTTTLAALLNHRNETTQGHIITIEDPIEYIHPHKKCLVSQREVGIDTESWESALMNALRQAPDVILMGEIRDREAMEQALAFSETGHLCLATMHANSANQAVDRIINFFPEERHQQLFMDLSMNLKAMVSQRLVPKKTLSGRVAAIEIMINSPLIADLIYKGEINSIKEIMKKSREVGMQTFDQHLFDLYESEQITLEDALRNADSVNDLRLQVKLNSKLKTEEVKDPLAGLSIMPSQDKHTF